MRVATIAVAIGLTLIAWVAVTSVVYAEQHSWIYNAGYLQGVMGAGLKGHPTIEFLQGYTKGTEQYWFNRGYVEGNNKLPKITKDANYTKAYTEATYNLTPGSGPLESPGLGRGLKPPVHSTDNYTDFYLGVYEGGVAGEKDQGPMPQGDQGQPMSHQRETLDGVYDQGYSLCPPGHTAEYCTGYLFGYWWASDVLG
jgi:hypothetical protein